MSGKDLFAGVHILFFSLMGGCGFGSWVVHGMLIQLARLWDGLVVTY
jgi:hypothetical protein